MREKKQIDRLFQEKLKNFETAPDDAVWENIHERLHKDKRKRRVIPIWWKLAGVAALLALFFTVGLKFISHEVNSDPINTVVDIEKKASDKLNNPSKTDSNNSDGIQNKIDHLENKTENASNALTENDSNSENDFKVNPEAVSDIKSEKDRSNQNIITKSSDKNGIVSSDNSSSEVNSSLDKSNEALILKGVSEENKTSVSRDAVIADSRNNENNSNQNNLDVQKEKTEIDKLIKDSKSDKNSKVTDASEKMETIISEVNVEDAKKSKSIEEAISETITEDKREKSLYRWNISPNVAPVYFNSLGQGSTLDEQFVNNENSSEVSMSYGVGGSYAISDRLKVRSGINKVDMGYSTNNVITFNGVDSNARNNAQLHNVNTNANAENVTFLSTESLNSSTTPEIINSKSNGSINQRFGFIEVPLEMEYALINKKLGMNVIGGFSTFIVDKNEIYSVIDGTETRIGEANNINNMSYSANFGLGINYNFSEKIKVNVEPTFKYQINTFNNSSGDFQPFFIGVYTGLSYKF